MRFFKFLLLLTALACFPAHAQTAAPEPDNLLTNGDFARQEEAWTLPGDGADTNFVAAQAGPFRRALSLSVTPAPGATPYSIMLAQSIAFSFKQGDPLVLKLWLRSPTSNTVGVFVEENKAPYEKSLGQELKLTPQWQEYELRGAAKADYPTEGLHLIFHLGYAPGTIEVAGVRLFNANAKPGLTLSNATPEHPTSLIANGDFSAPLEGNWGASQGPTLQTELVPATIDGNTHAMHLTINPVPDAAPWDVGLGQKVNVGVRRDDAIYLRLWMRSADRVRVGLYYELAAAPNTKSLKQMVRLTPEWQEYRFLGHALQSFGPGESQLRFHLGYDKGTAEIAGVRLEDYGRAPGEMFHETIDYWGGVTPSDDWRAPALARIEKIRKGDVTIRVVDAAGHPVTGAAVKIEQQSHFFRFGTAAPVARILDQKSPNSLRYQQELKRLYNTVTFESDLKWPNVNEASLQQVEQAADWLHANGITHTRGHNLLWGSQNYLPEAVQNLDKDALLKACHDHVTSLATRMRGKVYLWDVVNEAATNTWLWDTIGWENFANAYKWAHEADPDALLCYNDYDIINEAPNGGQQRPKVEARIRYLIDHGAPLDMIGIQGHMSTPLTPPGRIVEILDEMAQFGKPMEVTEFDVGVHDDAMHGQYVRDCMTAIFSHPSLRGFIMWGFWEGAHWRATDGGAMFRKDWTPRPAEAAWEDLVFHQWWTNATLTSDATGTARTRAFYGQHQVTVSKDGQQTTATLQLVPDKSGEMVVKLGTR